MDLTWLGWVWIIASVIALMVQSYRIGLPREPIKVSEVVCQAIVSVLLFWGYATVGVVH